jgi:hypothetical protein
VRSRFPALPIAILVAALALVPPSPASANVIHTRLQEAVRALPVAKHSHVGSYDREKDFGDWIDQGSGCDTRAVVLKAESLKPTTQNANCTVETGRWFSYYNATYYTQASSLQIDHTVPVENAWITGAWRWTHATRIRYYNDLGDTRTLVAADTHDNESKGDQDVSTWLPSHGVCRYLRSWVAVKTRWQLTVTERERHALTKSDPCPKAKLTVRTARVAYHP